MDALRCTRTRTGSEHDVNEGKNVQRRHSLLDDLHLIATKCRKYRSELDPGKTHFRLPRLPADQN